MIGHDLTPWFKCSSLVTQTKRRFLGISVFLCFLGVFPLFCVSKLLTILQKRGNENAVFCDCYPKLLPKLFPFPIVPFCKQDVFDSTTKWQNIVSTCIYDEKARQLMPRLFWYYKLFLMVRFFFQIFYFKKQYSWKTSAFNIAKLVISHLFIDKTAN